MTGRYDQLIEKGELAREQEKYSEALAAFDEALILSAEQEQWTELVNSLAHKLLIYKHLFQKTGNAAFNELMLGEAQTGLKIVEEKNIAGQPKAVLLMRTADYYFWKKDFPQAEQFYQQALNNVDKQKKGEYAEYLSHLALSQAIQKKADATDNLNEALRLAEADQALRPFHKSVIVSGIHMRLAIAYKQLNLLEQAQASYENAKVLAEQLNSEHQMPMRLKQLETVRKELGI